MTTVVSLAIALLTVGFVLSPLFRRHTSTEEPNETIEDLLAQRDNLYATIKDLEFDYLAGKLDAQDYQSLRSKYEAEAIEVLRQLDARNVTDPNLEGEGDPVEAEIERYLQRRRRSRGSEKPTQDENPGPA